MALVAAAGGPRHDERVRGGGPRRVRGEREGSVRGCCLFWGGVRMHLATARALVAPPLTLNPPRRRARRRRGWRRGQRVRSSCGRAAREDRQGGFIGGVGRRTARGGRKVVLGGCCLVGGMPTLLFSAAAGLAAAVDVAQTGRQSAARAWLPAGAVSAFSASRHHDNLPRMAVAEQGRAAVVRYHRCRVLRDDARGGAGGGDEAGASGALAVARLAGREKAVRQGMVSRQNAWEGREGDAGWVQYFWAQADSAAAGTSRTDRGHRRMPSGCRSAAQVRFLCGVV